VIAAMGPRHILVTDDDRDSREGAFYRVRASHPLVTDARLGEQRGDCRLVQWFTDRGEAERCAVALASDPRCYSTIDIEADDRGAR
jgi:hypothetical protein